MGTFYRHTQTGALIRWSVSLGALALLASVPICGGVYSLLMTLPFALLMIVVGWVFSSLTIEVLDSELQWFFGPGFWSKRVARAEIVSATPVTNKWWCGWGVHCTPRGWLYNVAGLAGVEVALRDGRTFRLGSDETSALAAALSAP